MVESRWFRRAGPAVAALGGIALIATTTVGAPRGAWTPDVCAGAPRIGDTASRDAGIGSIRSSATAPGPASGWSSGVPASAARERSTLMPSRSRPVRSAARPWSARMTAVVRGSRWSTRPEAAPGRWSPRATSSGPRRSRRMARPSTSSASTGRPAPTSASGDARSMAGQRRLASCPRSRPTPASARRGSRPSPGARTAGRSRCSRAARSRAASASSIRTAAACGSWPIRRSVTSSGSTAIAWSRTAPAVVSPARCSPWTS